jgi:hypothetical protein
MGKHPVLPSRPIACFCNGDYHKIHITTNGKNLYFINRKDVGHATCFYKCNGKLVYYDNNHGIFNISNNLDISQIDAVIYKGNHVEFAKVEITKLNKKTKDNADIYILKTIRIIRDDGNKSFNNIQPIEYPFSILLMKNKTYIVDAVAEDAVAEDETPSAGAGGGAAAAAGPPLVHPSGCGTFSCLRKLFSRKKQRQNAGKRLKRRKTRRQRRN